MAVPIRLNHPAIYYTGLGLMIISLPVSQFALSVSQFIILGNWLLEGDFKNKFKSFVTNKPAVVLSSLFVLHVAGLLYTTDLDYAIKDLRIKLPILALPVIFSTSRPIESRVFDLFIKLFIGSCLVATFIGFGILMTKDISDIREISPFISHIRLSLNICLAIFFSGHFLFIKYRNNQIIRIVLLLIILWFVTYLILSESATGFYVMTGTLIALLIFVFPKIKDPKIKWSLGISALLIPTVVVFYLYHTSKTYLTPDRGELKNLVYQTSQGNIYTHDTLSYSVENGRYPGLYVCDTELRDSWNSRSNLDYDGQDAMGHELKTTLIRYLNSRGFRKDAEGMKKLIDDDIRNIEKGIANYFYSKKFNLNSRMYKILWEFQEMKKGAGPGGTSFVQRLDFWKAATGIIRENFWTGVGTGDMDEAFALQYEKTNSKLAPEFRFRSHNQFLAIFTAFGFIGFLWFVFTLVYPPFQLKAFNKYRYVVFFLIIVLSMLTEDTLETQMGVTLYAFFNSFLLFLNKDDR